MISPHTSYTLIAREALRAALAGAPASTLRAIAERGARIHAVTGQGTGRVSGDLLDAAVSAARYYSHGADGQAAVATRITRALRAEDAPAVRWALDPSVTGALVRPRMRVRRAAPPLPQSRPSLARADFVAARAQAARGIAIRDLTLAISTFRAGRNTAVKNAARSKIRAILHTWQDDTLVAQAAIAAGWRM